MELLKLLNFPEVFVQVLSFLILLLLLRAFAWKRILGIIDQRRQGITEELSTVQQAKEAADKLRNDYEARLADIEQKARERINSAVEEGRLAADEIRKFAHTQANNIIADARKAIEYELKKAQDEVRDKIVDLAISAAEKVVSEKLTETGDRKIVEEFIDSIDNAET